MSGEAADRRRGRHDATAQIIVEEAWRLAERNGLAGISVGDLARAVEMRPQSLYTYFPSKQAIYDRMYKEGFAALVAQFDGLEGGHSDARGDPTGFLVRSAEAFVDFAAARPSRFQLMFQRTVPGFEPSAEAYAVAIEALERMRSRLRVAGVTRARHLDLWRALLLGLAGEQLANDPGGRRWRTLARDAARFFVSYIHAEKGRAP